MNTAIYYNGHRFLLISKDHLISVRSETLITFIIKNGYELIGYGEF